MKKIISLLLFTLFSSSIFATTVNIVNETNQSWKAKVAYKGRYITGFRRAEQDDKITFYNIPVGAIVKITSMERIKQPTARLNTSSRYGSRHYQKRRGLFINFSKQLNFDSENLIIYIKETPADASLKCPYPVSKKEEYEMEVGQGGICYYIESFDTEEPALLMPTRRPSRR